MRYDLAELARLRCEGDRGSALPRPGRGRGALAHPVRSDPPDRARGGVQSAWPAALSRPPFRLLHGSGAGLLPATGVIELAEIALGRVHVLRRKHPTGLLAATW